MQTYKSTLKPHTLYIFRESDSLSLDPKVQSLEDQLHTILEVRKQIEVALTKVIEFEEKLALISPQRLEMLRPDMLTPYSIEHLSHEFPFINWKDFFASALQSTINQGKLIDCSRLIIKLY